MVTSSGEFNDAERQYEVGPICLLQNTVSHHTPPISTLMKTWTSRGARQEYKLKDPIFSISKGLYKLFSEPLPLEEWLIFYSLSDTGEIWTLVFIMLHILLAGFLHMRFSNWYSTLKKSDGSS